MLAVLIVKETKKVRFARIDGDFHGLIPPRSGHILVQSGSGKISSMNLLRLVNRFRQPHVMFM